MKLINLFKNTSKAGDTFFRGSLTKEIDVIILKNSFKSTDTQPDYIASLKIKEDNKLYELTGLWKQGNILQGKLLSGVGVTISKLENVPQGSPEFEMDIVTIQPKPVENFE